MCKKNDSDPFSGFQHGFRSSRCTADLLAVVSYRIAMAFISYRDTHDTAFNIPKASDRFGILVFFANSSLIEFHV